jgi:hypothetical protein
METFERAYQITVTVLCGKCCVPVSKQVKSGHRTALQALKPINDRNFMVWQHYQISIRLTGSTNAQNG